MSRRSGHRFADKDMRQALKAGLNAPAACDLVLHLGVGHSAETSEHLKFEELRVVEPQGVRGFA